MVDVEKIAQSELDELQPIWLITAGCLLVVSLIAWFLADWFYAVLGNATPYFLAVVPGCIFAVLYGMRAKEQRAIIKSVFDISWNIWTLIGAAFLLHAAASVQNPFDVSKFTNDLSGTLKNSNPTLLSFIFVWVYPTAVERVVIALSDALWKPHCANPDEEIATDTATEPKPV